MDSETETNVNTSYQRFVVDKLRPRSEYRFSLRAFNSAGASPWSNPKILNFVGQRPAPPRNVFVNRSSSDPHTLEIRLAFPAQKVPIKMFKVYYSKDELQWHVREEQPITMFELRGVELNTLYSVRVASVGEDCLESPYSEVARETTGRDRLGELRAITISSTSVRLSWPLGICAETLGETSNFFIVRYVFRGRQDSNFRDELVQEAVREVNTTSNSIVLNNLKLFSMYNVTVIAPRQPCSLQRPLELTIKTGIGVPPQPEAPEFRDVVPPSAVRLYIRRASSEHGYITNYWIIVVPLVVDRQIEPAEKVCGFDRDAVR